MNLVYGLVLASLASITAKANACTEIAAKEKAKNAAVVIDEVSFDRQDVSVVTAGSRMFTDRQWIVSVQVRGMEIGGHTWTIAVDKRTCNIMKVEFNPIVLESL